MMHYYVGTSGFSYKQWKGVFYPPGLPDREMLTFYGQELPAVEINATFYRMPRKSTLNSWVGQVPTGFRFALKAPRKITHNQPLKGKDDDVNFLFETAVALGEKLGAILFQLPPYLKKDIGLFADFADRLPPGIRVAFEFRHRSWFDDNIHDIMHKKRHAWCCTDTENEDMNLFAATADWGYLRLRRLNYTEGELLEWLRKVKSQNWQAAYVFFKHEDEGIGPRLARQFLQAISK
jgi:uncharacterized protein YecE (DUF72 family)